MPLTIKVNGTSNSLAHKMSSGITSATIPDVCKTPSPGGPVPVPYPNVAQSITLAGGTTSVKGDKVMAANKGSKFLLSNGDNAGVAGGVKSSTFMKEATWILYSFDVKLNKKNACRLTDKMFHNAENAANLGGYYQGDVVVTGVDKEVADELCKEFCDDLQKNFKQNKKTGEWTHRKSAVKGTRWSDKLEARLKAVEHKAPWKKWRVTFQNKYLRKAPIPDALRKTAGGLNWRSFDFKFPGDYPRKGKKKGQWGQIAKQKRLCRGRPPLIISPDTCNCS